MKAIEMSAPETQELERQGATDVLIRLYRYWIDKHRFRPFPSRKDIDPIEFRFALGRVSLVDVLPYSPRFRYRLVSTAITDRLGYELTNKFTADIRETDIRLYVEDLYGRVLDTRRPLYEKSSRMFHNQLWQHEALALPLSTDGQAIDMLMVYRWTYDPAPFPAGEEAVYRDLARKS